MKIIRCVTKAGRTVQAALGPDGTARVISGSILGDFAVTDEVVEVDRLLAPLAPVQVIGIGLNYRRHAEESGMATPKYPVVFNKTLNSVVGPDAPIVLPKGAPCEKPDYEVELAVVIGKECKDVPRAEALSVVLGYTAANDVSARDWQLEKGGSQWSRGKSFDTFCPLGPVLVTADELQDPGNLRVSTTLNGEVVQDWNTNDMIFDVPTLIEYLSSGTTLLAGTVILTGTPHGVGMGATPPRWLKPGDDVVVEVEHIGRLSNRVVAE